ncbi:MAG: ABC transporter permease [bacterium]
MKIFYALFKARNKEYIRDRATLAWNLGFPLLVIFGFALGFSGTSRELYKVGVMGAGQNGNPAQVAFLETRFVKFIPVPELSAALEKVRRHQYDMVLDLNGEARYWINDSNPKGYFLERVLWGSEGGSRYGKEVLSGREIRYIDWLLPGLLGMNMMFSCLFGVGYVIVRYRKGGILRRFKVTPISAFHFIAAQVGSRLMLVLVMTAMLFLGTDLVLDFFFLGSLVDLAVVFLLGAICMISLGLLIATRTQSLELAGGLMNLGAMPMMFLSEVWFSLEGGNPWLINLSKAFPLTHLVKAARGIMVDGAGLADVFPQIAVLIAMTLVFMTIGAALFRWE